MIPFDFQPALSIQPQEGSVIVPAGVESKAELFAFLSVALSLPDYFGNNWDALEECLVDSEWLSQPKIILVHQDIPLEKHPSDQWIYLEILAETARKSGRFHIVFPVRCQAQIAHILEK